MRQDGFDFQIMLIFYRKKVLRICLALSLLDLIILRRGHFKVMKLFALRRSELLIDIENLLFCDKSLKASNSNKIISTCTTESRSQKDRGR